MSTSGMVLELTLRRSDAPTPPTGSDLLSGLMLTARTRTSHGLCASCAKAAGAANDEANAAAAAAMVTIFFTAFYLSSEDGRKVRGYSAASFDADQAGAIDEITDA